MTSGDIFVYLDDVEYSKNSFHNRNFMKGPQGKMLLTVPVKYKGNARKYICEIPINNETNWAKKHWRSIEMNYNKTPYFQELEKIIRPQIYNQNWDTLGNLNIAFIEIIRNYLNINCDIYLSSELGIKSKGNQKLVDICKLLGANKFIVKPNTESYHPKEFFETENISLVNFEPVSKPYAQKYGEFIPNLSALDYVMNHGNGKLLW